MLSKKIISALLFVSFFTVQCTTTQPTTMTAKVEAPTSEIDQKVQALLAKMTLKDKVGEMTQLSIDAISVGTPYNLEKPNRLDPEKLKKVLLDYRVGSILNCGGYAYTREYWHETIKTIQDIAVKEKPTGIPVIYGIDAIHGANYTINSTLFPQQIAQAAAWDTDMAKRIARATAYETRASWIPWNFSPVLDLGADARWPRLWETFGEDVFLSKSLGKAVIEGYEGTNNDLDNPERVASCLKHFLGYGTPRSGRDRTPTYIHERQLREYHLPTFQAAIDAGAMTIMVNSGDLNGIPVHSNYDILTTLLRDELGFEGFVVSDWEDIGKLIDNHRIAHDYKEATKMAINAGVDMAMVPMTFDFSDALLELVEEGEVTMERIDEAVGRILKVKFKLGLFEQPYPKHEYPDFNSQAHQDLSYEAAKECVTLLKNNDNILPLKKENKILVVGPNANNMMDLNGGWSRTWQGTDPQWDTPNKKTVFDAIQDKVGAANATYIKGAEFDKKEDIEAAVAAAKAVDVILACLGEHPYTETPGSIKDLNLPRAQEDLITALKATGKPIVVILLEGRPRIINRVEPNTEAILTAYIPGEEGGRAIADVLFGDHNPSGKLPYTYPRYANDLITYNHVYTERFDKDYGQRAFKPQFEFGHGMSYTTFEYSDLNTSTLDWTNGNTLTMSVNVKNTGERAGKEVVQLYISDLVATVSPPVKRLRGFEKISLEAGETKTVKFEVTLRDVAFVGRNNQWTTEPGDYMIRIGGLEQKVNYRGDVLTW